MGKVVDTGIPHHARIQWCINGDFTDWTGTGSGFIDVTNRYPGRSILGFMPLADKVYLSLERAIMELIPTGNPAPAFTVEQRILGVGLAAPRSWAEAEYFGFFLGDDAQVYRWDGANLTAVGTPVQKAIQAALQPVISAAIRRVVQGAINLADQEYWLLIDDADDNLFIYDYRRDRWYRDNYPVTPNAIGPARKSTLSNYSSIFVGHSDRTVSAITPDVATYNGSNVTRYVETPDFSAQEIRAGQLIPALQWHNAAYCLRFRWTGSNPVEVGYSLDKGANWTTQSVTVGSDSIGEAWFVVDFTQIRFRLKITSGTFGLPDLLTYEWERSGQTL